MKPRKLSDRAYKLLALVNDATAWEGDERPGTKLTRYFIPDRNPMWSSTLGEHIDVSTGGDAAALRGLENRGLIAPMKPGQSGPMRYWYQITEDGIKALADRTEAA